MFPMILMPLFGAWYLYSMPADSRSWATGGSMTTGDVLQHRHRRGVGDRRLRPGRPHSSAALHQRRDSHRCSRCWPSPRSPQRRFVREGVRIMPYTVRQFMYSIRSAPSRVAELRRSARSAPILSAETPRTLIRTSSCNLGRRSIAFSAASCHTIAGANAARRSRGQYDDRSSAV